MIAGQYVDANNVFHGFRRDPSGKITTFDVRGAGTGPGQGTIPTYNDDLDGLTGFYINSAGVAVGFTQTP